MFEHSCSIFSRNSCSPSVIAWLALPVRSSTSRLSETSCCAICEAPCAATRSIAAARRSAEKMRLWSAEAESTTIAPALYAALDSLHAGAGLRF